MSLRDAGESRNTHSVVSAVAVQRGFPWLRLLCGLISLYVGWGGIQAFFQVWKAEQCFRNAANLAGRVEEVTRSHRSLTVEIHFTYVYQGHSYQGVDSAYFFSPLPTPRSSVDLRINRDDPKEAFLTDSVFAGPFSWFWPTFLLVISILLGISVCKESCPIIGRTKRKAAYHRKKPETDHDSLPLSPR